MKRYVVTISLGTYEVEVEADDAEDAITCAMYEFDADAIYYAAGCTFETRETTEAAA